MKESFEYYKQIQRLLTDFLEKRSVSCEGAGLESILWYIQAKFSNLELLCRTIRAVTCIEDDENRIEEYKSILQYIEKELEGADK